MAIQQHLVTAWVWQATAGDRRTGFVQMTRAEFDAGKLEGRMQDPRVGALHMKHIVSTPFEPPIIPRGTAPATAPTANPFAPPAPRDNPPPARRRRAGE